MQKGKIYLIPTLLGNTAPSEILPVSVLGIVKNLKYFIAENIRTARRFLKMADAGVSIDDMVFFELNRHTKESEIERFIEPAMAGNDTGLLSEAGVPCIADPGSAVTWIAHRKGLRVIPLTGPSSIIMALMASGLNGQSFVFHGYLPVKQDQRTARVKKIEKDSGYSGQAQIFMETPYRNMQMFETIVSACKPGTFLCIACDITSGSEFIATRTVADWRKDKPDINKRPAIFIIQERMIG